MRIKEAVSSLIQEAIDCHASDLFFLTQKGKLVVNFRIINGIANQANFSINEGKDIICAYPVLVIILTASHWLSELFTV